MKKIIILVMLMVSSPLMADSIPGWLELDISYQKWVATVDSKYDYSNTEIGIKYGGEFGWFKPYMLFNTQTYFTRGNKLLSNHPFYDLYTIGMGIELNNIFYIELMHSCSHEVISLKRVKENHTIYKALTDYTHNHIKVGLKFKID